MKRIISVIERYLLRITTVIYLILILIFGNENWIVEILNQVIIIKNDIIVNIASIFIGMYITLALMYPTYIKGSGLDILSSRSYYISYKYILYGLLWASSYIINFLLDGIFYSCILINIYLFILLFVSFVRIFIIVILWQTFDIKKAKRMDNNEINYEKKIYERLKNIEDYLKYKK